VPTRKPIDTQSRLPPVGVPADVAKVIHASHAFTLQVELGLRLVSRRRATALGTDADTAAVEEDRATIRRARGTRAQKVTAGSDTT
jgi:hypothetical protein